jgi:hypothetical protein
MLNSNERAQHLKEIQSKLWNKDLLSLSNREITETIRNMFYQMFLVEITDFNFAIRYNGSGNTVVKFIIEGDAFGDSDTISDEDIEDEGDEEMDESEM